MIEKEIKHPNESNQKITQLSILKNTPITFETFKEEKSNPNLIEKEKILIESKDKNSINHDSITSPLERSSQIEKDTVYITQKRLQNNEKEENILNMDYLHNKIINYKSKAFAPLFLLWNHSLNTTLTDDKEDNNKTNQIANLNLETKSNCHYCKAIGIKTKMKQCTINSCGLFYCDQCFKKFNDIDHNESGDSEKECINNINNDNNWKCLKCEGRCQCLQCRIGSNRKRQRKGRNKLASKIQDKPIKKNIITIPYQSNEYNWNNIYECNNFDIIEFPLSSINSHGMNQLNRNYDNIGYKGTNQETNFLSQKEANKLLNMPSICDGHLIYNKRKEEEKGYEDDDDYNNKTFSCYICNYFDFLGNEVLRFKTPKELLNYLKYSFYYLSKLLKINPNVFEQNKRSLNQTNNSNSFMKFREHKIICKCCYMRMLNKENFLTSLKSCFDIDNTNPYKQNTKNRRRKSRRRKNKCNTNNQIEIIPNNSDKAIIKTVKPKESFSIIETKYHNPNVTYDKINHLIIIDKKELGLKNIRLLSIESNAINSNAINSISNKSNYNCQYRPNASSINYSPIVDYNNNTYQITNPTYYCSNAPFQSNNFIYNDNRLNIFNNIAYQYTIPYYYFADGNKISTLNAITDLDAKLKDYCEIIRNIKVSQYPQQFSGKLKEKGINVINILSLIIEITKNSKDQIKQIRESISHSFRNNIIFHSNEIIIRHIYQLNKFIEENEMSRREYEKQLENFQISHSNYVKEIITYSYLQSI